MMTTATVNKSAARVVSHNEWLAARKQFLAKEKEFSRQRDELSRLRRELPWEKVEKEYVFEGANGTEKLGELFDGRSQLLVYHFMFGPGWKEGCPSCSFLADAFDSFGIHLAQRDTSFVAVSRATLPEIEGFKKRMGWKFKWVSSNGSDFNYDYNVSFTNEQVSGGKPNYNYGTIPAYGEEVPGASAFIKKDGQVFHTYSTYARGLDILLPMYNWIDLTAKGRDEANIQPHAMAWVNHNGIDTDEYRPDHGTDVMERLGVDPHQPSVVYVGRITRQKGLPYLLRAAAQFPPDVQLVLLAGAPDTPEIAAEVEALADTLKRTRQGVVWVQEMLPKPSVIQVLTHGTVFVCPSVYEPMGIVNLEAMACETAVVATATGGIPEVVADGETGHLVPISQAIDGTGTPLDPDRFVNDLAVAVNEVLADPGRASALGKAGRRRAVEHFSWAAIAERTIEVYRSVLTT